VSFTKWKENNQFQNNIFNKKGQFFMLYFLRNKVYDKQSCFITKIAGKE